MRRSILALGLMSFLLTCGLHSLAHGSGHKQDEREKGLFCRSLGFASVKFSGFSEFDSAQDFCLQPLIQMRPVVAIALKKFGALNMKAAQFFGITYSRLIPKGIDLVIKRSSLPVFDSGALESKNDRNAKIYIAMDSSLEITPLIAYVYAHEIGHVSGLSKDSGVHPNFLTLSRTTLGIETMADALAMSIVGPVKSTFDCLTMFRPIDGNQSYRALRGAFTAYGGGSSIHQCCVQQKPQSHSCKAFETQWREWKDVPVGSELAFDPSDVATNLAFYDTHLIGRPINSFIFDLSRFTGEDVGQIFYESFRRGGDRIVMHCEIPNLRGIFPKFEVERISFKSVLKTFRTIFMKRDQVELFDQLWSKHDLDSALKIAEADDIREALLESSRHYLRTLSKKLNSEGLAKHEKLPQSGCSYADIGVEFSEEKFEIFTESIPGCGVRCSSGY